MEGRPREELEAWARDVADLPRAPMQPYLRPPDFVLHCDASDSAVAGILVEAPGGTHVGARFWRRLDSREALWSSCLREMTGYDHSFAAFCRTRDLRGCVVEVVGDHQAAKFIFANGGSSCVDEETGTLLITDTLIHMLVTAKANQCEVRFRWVRHELVQDADDLSKWCDRMDFSLRPVHLAAVRAALGAWDVDRFAAPHNATCQRFNSLFGCATAEATDALAQDWRVGVSFVLPDFFTIDAVLDLIERDDANVILVVPEWRSKPWWGRLWSSAWATRRRRHLQLPVDAVVPHDEHCFFAGHDGRGRLNVGLVAVRLGPSGDQQPSGARPTPGGHHRGR